MSDRPQVQSELSRDLTLFHITMMSLGMMIGAGVFVGIGITIPKAGTGGLLLTFALNGMIAMFTAMSFAELSSAIPRAGGAYNFARIGFGRGASFITGWMEWFASSLAGAFYAVVFAQATVSFVAGFLMGIELAPGVEHWIVRMVALTVAGLFIYVNYRGSRETGKVGAFFTIAQMLFVLSIGIFGVIMAIVEPQRLENFQPFLNHPKGWWRLLGTMGVIYVAFEGFEVVAQAGDETIDPKRNVPKAMLYSVVIVTVTYLLVALASVVAFKHTGPGEGTLVHFLNNADDPIAGFTGSVEQLVPKWGTLLVTLAIIASSTSALNATIYSATRASFALGRDRMLPAAFAKLSSKRKTPYVALAATGVIVLTAAAGLDAHHGAATASIMFLFLFFVVNLCVVRIRRNMGDELDYGYVMPLFPLFPIAAIICQGALAGGIMGESKVAWIIGPGWVAVGLVVYHLYSKSRVAPADHEIHVLEEAPAPAKGDGYRLMVSVANPDNALELVQNTYKLCRAKDARVELLHMVPVPDQVPLSDASKYMLEGREGILETMLYLAPMFPVSGHLRYCRNIARGIISAVREKKIDLLVLGWHGRGKTHYFHLGSTIDPVIERSPCNVVVFKNCGGNRKFTRVLVPIAGGPNSALALETASILADPSEGRITAFTVANQRHRFDIDAFAASHRQHLSLSPAMLTTKTLEADDPVEAILAEANSDQYDLVVLGCTRKPMLRQITSYPVPETIARRCGKAVVMVRAAGGIRSWVRRWI